MCPVGALRVALATTPESAYDRPLLSWTNGLPYTSGEFVTRLRNLFKIVSEPPLAYGCHSFRRGGATHAFRIGVPTELIRSLGDWRSEAYTRYIVSSPDTTDITIPMVYKS